MRFARSYHAPLSAKAAPLARLAAAGATLLLWACGDSASRHPEADVEPIAIRDLGGGPDADNGPLVDATPLDLGAPPVSDLGILDAFHDAVVPWDLAPRPDAAACTPTLLGASGGAAVFEAGTGDVTTSDGGVFWRVTVVDQRGRPLAGAAAGVILGPDAFTMVFHAPGHLAAVLNVPLMSGTYGFNAARQASEGPGAKEVLGAAEVPECARGTQYVSVLAAMA